MDDRLSILQKRVKAILGWTLFILLIVTQWEARPWALFSLTFFTIAMVWQALDFYNQPRAWKGFMFTGGSLNGLALFANGGRMPVLGRTETARWWEPLTEDSRLVPLCDIYSKASIGDMIILAGIIVGITVWLVHRNRNPVKAETATA